MSNIINRLERLIIRGKLVGSGKQTKVLDAEILLELYQVCKLLYSENADYIKINNLGDVHHNQSMKRARDVLSKIESES